jgi:hypothetical protein
MSDDTVDPQDLTAGVPLPREWEAAPGRLDMSAFEESFVGADGLGLTVEWAILWPDGRSLVVDSQEAALTVARHNRRCRVLRRCVGPWQVIS